MSSVLPAALAGSAALVLTLRAPSRQVAASSPAPRPRPSGLSPTMARAACGLAALAAWAVIGGPAGLAGALLVLLLGPRGLARIDAREDEDAVVAKDLPLALDLLAACLTGGAVALDAVRAVSSAVPGPCGARLAAVAARLAVGSEPSEAWRSLGHDRGPAGAAARAMSRASVGGAPVAAAVQRVAADARREAAGQATRAARRAGVLAVGPLGLCFLPAFLLLGVVPAVLGLAAPLLTSL